MSEWTPQRVLDAAAATEFVPEGAIEVRTGDYRLLRHADWVLGPSLGAAQVTWSRTARPLGEVIGEVAARVRGWGLPGVAWWVSGVTRPDGTDEALRDHGAGLIDASQRELFLTGHTSSRARQNASGNSRCRERWGRVVPLWCERQCWKAVSWDSVAASLHH